MWSLDTEGGLWLRSGVGPHCPEGAQWVPVCQGVRTCSSGQAGLWAVLEEGGGVLARYCTCILPVRKRHTIPIKRPFHKGLFPNPACWPKLDRI